MTSILSILLVVLLAPASETPADNHDADQLADAVMKAAGGDVWPNVTRIHFTFNVEREGKRLLSAKHEWDVRAGTDTVTWGEKTITVNVNESNHEGDAKQAYARFINDSYWLLAPLKVKDSGVFRSTGDSEEIEGKKYLLLHLSFEQVGLTPGDRYNLWIDPQTKLVRWWDYIPATGNSSRASWEEYREVGGLMLAMKHVSGRATITFTDVLVSVE